MFKCYKKLFLLIIGMLLISFGGTSLAQAAGEVQLPSGIVIGDQNGIHVRPNGKFLVEINDVLPGKKWRSEITLSNEEKSGSYELTLQIKPPTVSGPIDFSKAIAMKLSYEGDEFYNGTVSGLGESLDLQKNVYSLGTFKSGDSRKLVAEFEMDSSYTKEDFEIKSITENIWEFRAIKKTNSNTGESSSSSKLSMIGKLPQTSEEWQEFLIYISLGLLMLALALWIFKRNKEKSRS